MTQKALYLVATSRDKFLLVDLLRVLAEYKESGTITGGDFSLLFSAIINKIKDINEAI